MKPGYRIQPEEAFTPNNTAVSVQTTSTIIIAANYSRNGLVIVNDSANVVYLALGAGPAVANQGIRLNANGGSIQFDSNSLFANSIYGIAVGGASNVTVCDF